jgi:hypothetical protein
MSELEKFLQQAAQRMKERLEEQQAAQRRTQRRPAAPVRQVERAAPQYDDDEILEAELSDQPVPVAPPRPAPPKKRLSQLEERSERQRGLQSEQKSSGASAGKQRAEERMAERLHQVFDHAIGQLGQRPKSSISAPTIFGSPGQTGLSSEVDRRERATSPLIQMLKEPDSLRAAFIVGEIFKRKF